jgi:predicted double-glycine peptidase
MQRGRDGLATIRAGRQGRRAAALLAAAVALAGSGPSPGRAEDRGPVRSMLEMRQEGVVVQQWDLSCGAAALATLLTYQHGDAVSEREITRALIRREEYLENPELVRIRQGFSLLDLKRVAEARGYTGIGYGGLSLENLVAFAPVMVPISTAGYNHFVIFRGSLGDRVLLADPAFGNRTMTIARFEAAWMDLPDLGRVGFVVTRGDEPAPPGRLAPRPELFLAPPTAAVRETLPF